MSRRIIFFPLAKCFPLSPARLGKHDQRVRRRGAKYQVAREEAAAASHFAPLPKSLAKRGRGAKVFRCVSKVAAEACQSRTKQHQYKWLRALRAIPKKRIARAEREATRYTISSTIARAFPESICVPVRLVKLARRVSTADKIARKISSLYLRRNTFYREKCLACYTQNFLIMSM